MSRPTSIHDAADLVRRARLVGEEELEAIVARQKPETSAIGLLETLVSEGCVTPYQAEEIANGRWLGFWLGSYKILDRLGKGGMGQVYLAEHSILKKRVAIKVLSIGFRSDPQARQRFVHEARAASAIDHPNVVHVRDVDINHDPPYLVMEYIDGVSLQAAVSLTGSFSGGEAAAVGVEVCHGLQAAAMAGLVHRDVKPANILIDRRGGVKILDLGIARLPGDDGQNQGDGSEVILGTIDYLAPEQAVDSVGVDARADLYALGATLYFLIAGHPPFPSPNLRHKLAAKQYCDPPPVHRLRPDVDAGVSAVIQKLLHREPADRFQSASDAAAALTPFAGLPSNFPARLFQLKKPSTVHDAMAAPEPEFPLPATQRIIRPDTLPTPTDLPLPQYDTSAEGHPTDEVRKSPTDLSLAALPDSAKPKSPLRSDVAPPAMALRPGSIWLWLAGLVGLVGLGIAVLIAWG